MVVPVGDRTADALREKLVPAIQALRVGISTDPEAHYGPVVNAAHKQRVENWIQTCADEGGELVVDGREAASVDLVLGDQWQDLPAVDGDVSTGDTTTEDG